MATMNIGGSKDPAYRYKMPRLVSKIEGRGNGIKTVVVNCVDIAKSLNRLPTTVIKYLGVELGAQSRFEADSERAIVNGAFETEELQTTLNGFIDKFVLCPVCHLPETVLSVKLSAGTIWHKCQACGAKEMVDMAHKLCKSILNDAKTEAKEAKKGGKKDKKEKKGKESKEAKDARKAAKKEAKKAKKEAKKAKRAAGEADSPDADGKSSEEGSDDDGVVWHTDLSEEAVRARSEELARQLSASAAAVGGAGGASGGAAGDDAAASGGADDDDDMFEGEAEEVVDAAEGAVEAAVDTLTEYLSTASGESRTPDAVAEEVRDLQTNSALPPASRVLVYWRAAFDDDVAKQTADAGKLAELGAVMRGGGAGFQAALLDAVVDHVGVRSPELSKVAPLVLKNLYDADVLEEGAALKWASQDRDDADDAAADVIDKCAPFITWLQTADEESSSGESGSDDE
mmetsp:Transcript_15772/g.54821  ORF Transcript_15772/g.54821 Transcript_15772/m.54821 type:complete len:457 (-) Transcript_15772:222-1592(-)